LPSGSELPASVAAIIQATLETQAIPNASKAPQADAPAISQTT